jgi:sugar phosphate isomerase/epimerase
MAERRRAALGPDDLVLTASSIGLPPFAVLCEAASAGGFAGVSIWPAEGYRAALESGMTVEDLHQLLDEHRLVVHDVDAVVAWAGPNDPGPPYLQAAPAALVYEAAAALGAGQVNAVVVGERGVSHDDLAEAMAVVCDAAAAYGLVVGFEFARASALRSLADALAVRSLLPHHDVGVTVDTWQLHWGPSTVSELAEAPGEAVRCVQVDDAPATRPDDLLRATYEGRLVPGEGAADLDGVVCALDGIGYRGPLTVEAINAELIAAYDPVTLACRLGDATRGVVARARRENQR